MKTIEELSNLGAAAAALKKTFLIGISPGSQFWEGDQPAREAFARAVRDAVLADQPAADVPTWRPIEELPENTDIKYAFTNGVTCWGINPLGATHFIAPPPRPDPFDAWWDANHTLSVCGMADARAIWNAARKEKP